MRVLFLLLLAVALTTAMRSPAREDPFPSFGEDPSQAYLDLTLKITTSTCWFSETSIDFTFCALLIFDQGSRFMAQFDSVKGELMPKANEQLTLKHRISGSDITHVQNLCHNYLQEHDLKGESEFFLNCISNFTVICIEPFTWFFTNGKAWKPEKIQFHIDARNKKTAHPWNRVIKYEISSNCKYDWVSDRKGAFYTEEGIRNWELQTYTKHTAGSCNTGQNFPV